MLEADAEFRSYSVTTVPMNLGTPQFWASADITVYDVKSGVWTELTLDTHYTLSGAGTEGGGTCALTSRANTGTSSIVIICDPARDQSTDYIRNDDFPSDSHETALDRLTRMVQRARSLAAGYNQPILAFTDADATPSVAGGSYFITANTGATTITALDGGTEGQEVWILIGDGNTTFDFSGTTLKGNAGADWTPASGDALYCKLLNGSWYCSPKDTTA